MRTVSLMFAFIGLIYINLSGSGSWSSSSDISLSLNLPKVYFMNIETSEEISDFSYTISSTNKDAGITLEPHVQDIASISAISNDRNGYVIKITKSANNFALTNSDPDAPNIKYTLKIASGDNHTGSSNINQANTELLSVNPSDDPKRLHVKEAKLQINIPRTKNLIFDDPQFNDTITLGVVAK